VGHIQMPNDVTAPLMYQNLLALFDGFYMITNLPIF
jgi:hypothetical protein